MKEDQKELIVKTRRKIHFWLSLGFVFFLLSILLSYFVFALLNKKQEAFKQDIVLPNKSEKTFTDIGNKVRRYIDGVYVEKGEENFYPVAIMIDNHIDARPPCALSRANLVFEAEAEGGITRYLAFFAGGDDLDKIGPIRSARPYFIDWAKEFSALYTHVGGSPEALVKMSRDNVFHLNEFYNGDYFWRDKERDRPHNVFTSSELLNKYLLKKKKTEGRYFPWFYKDDAGAMSRGDDKLIKINYSLPGYVVAWKYDKVDNFYTRYLDDKEHKDAKGNFIKAKNVLIEVAKAKETDAKLRLKMHTIGEGEAYICLDGFCKKGIWKKKNAGSRTRFYVDGDEVKLNAGTTWVEVVRPEIEVEIE